MPVILVSSEHADTGAEVARVVADRLGYRLLGPEILTDVAIEHGVESSRLIEALEAPPSLLGLSSELRSRYLAFIEAAVCAELVHDGVVCHGLAAHLYVTGVSHVLKVRVLCDRETRAVELAEQGELSVRKARTALAREVTARRRWSKAAYGRDETDATLYDLVVKIGQIRSDRACGVIAETAGDRAFRAMTYSMKRLDDLLLQSRVRAVVSEQFPGAQVAVLNGRVTVRVTALKRDRKRHQELVEELVGGVQGVATFEVEILEDFLGEAAESLR